MKRFFSCVLTFMLVLSLGTTAAFASEPTSDSLDEVEDIRLEVVCIEENDELIPVDPESFQTTPDLKSALPAQSDKTTYANVRDYAGVREITLQPVVTCVETGAMYIHPMGYRRTWAQGPQFAGLHVTSAQVENLITQTLHDLKTNPAYSKYTWSVVGWAMNSKLELSANRPQYLELTGDDTFLGSGETTKTSINSSGIYSIATLLTSSMRLDKRYNFGYSGAFYYVYTQGPNTGKLGGTMLNFSVTLNSDL